MKFILSFKVPNSEAVAGSGNEIAYVLSEVGARVRNCGLTAPDRAIIRTPGGEMIGKWETEES